MYVSTCVYVRVFVCCRSITQKKNQVIISSTVRCTFSVEVQYGVQCSIAITHSAT